VVGMACLASKVRLVAPEGPKGVYVAVRLAANDTLLSRGEA
jgi:hypothetical protein